MLYSRFDYSLAVNFSFNLVVFVIIGQIAMIYRFNVYDRNNRNKEISGGGNQYSISSKIFGDWDWSIKSLNQKNIQTQVTMKACLFEIDRTRIQDFID